MMSDSVAPSQDVKSLIMRLKHMSGGLVDPSAHESKSMQVSPARAGAGREDATFDKTVQQLVHENLPMGVIMIPFGADGIGNTVPVINKMACEMFGYSRETLSRSCTSLRGWLDLYHTMTRSRSISKLFRAVAGLTESYVMTCSYIHQSGWVFEGLESRKITYGRDGVPQYVTIYIQRCDGPVVAQSSG